MVLETNHSNINSKIHIDITITANKLSRVTDKKTWKAIIYDIQ